MDRPTFAESRLPTLPPPVVETRFLGNLEFKGGFPTDETLEHIYDRLDFQRGCQAFLRHLMAAAIWGFQQAFTRDLDMGPTDLLIMHADANGLALTANSETIYAVAMIDTKPGPVVLDVPPRVLGFLNDQWMRPMGDLGIVGPDHGEGGRYLLVPPGYEGDLPTDGYVATLRLRTYRQWFVLRAFMGPDGDPAPAFQTLQGARIAPLAGGGDAAPTRHIDGTGLSFDIDSDRPIIRYFEDLATMVDYEPADAISLDEAAEWPSRDREGESPSRPTSGCADPRRGRRRSAATWRSPSPMPRAATTSGPPIASGSAFFPGTRRSRTSAVDR